MCCIIYVYIIHTCLYVCACVCVYRACVCLDFASQRPVDRKSRSIRIRCNSWIGDRVPHPTVNVPNFVFLHKASFFSVNVFFLLLLIAEFSLLCNDSSFSCVVIAKVEVRERKVYFQCQCFSWIKNNKIEKIEVHNIYIHVYIYCNYACMLGMSMM